MSKLRDLESGPVAGRQRRDQASNHAGLTDIPRVSADNNNGHKLSFVRASRARDRSIKSVGEQSGFAKWHYYFYVTV